MRDLTEIEKQTLYWHESEGLTLRETAEKLGVARDTVKCNLRRAREQRGLLRDGVAEDIDPEVADSVGIVKTALKEVGFGAMAQERVAKKMLLGMVPEEVTEEPTTEDMVRQLGIAQMNALLNIDPLSLAASSAKDNAYVMKTLGEHRQLLKGLPTQIMGREERQKLDELAPALLREIKRRGLTIDAIKQPVTVYQEEPQT